MARHRGLKVGGFIMEFFTPSIGQMLKTGGCDFAVLDMEHSGVGFDTIKSTTRFMRSASIPVIVRVPSKSSTDIARALDAGAEGLMLPSVSSAEEAAHIVSSSKYVPTGKRGVALIPAHDRWPELPLVEKMAAANRQTTLFLQIETGEGVANADSIAAMAEIDCLWVGHMDLSCSLGIPGQFDHENFKRAIDTVRSACRKHNKSLGRLARNADEAAALHREGFDFLSYSSDVGLFQAAVGDGIAKLRKQCSIVP
ncbi:MAG TPA: aldolase/citrate lyase family protein [Phycisphaerae bacterium]|nr:aldolase/citrate lyase family protein [Phycisphaerae bacterium]